MILDHFDRDCFFYSTSAMHKPDFVQAINSGFHSGGMFCTLSDSDLGKYLLGKVMAFMQQQEPRIIQAVSCLGQQDGSSPYFILSPEVQKSHVCTTII